MVSARGRCRRGRSCGSCAGVPTLALAGATALGFAAAIAAAAVAASRARERGGAQFQPRQEGIAIVAFGCVRIRVGARIELKVA